MKIKQLPFNKSNCPWHKNKNGAEYKDYGNNNLIPSGCCPFLYHSLYPYFLGLLYGADMNGIHVGCPAEKGVYTYVYKEDNNGIVPTMPDDYHVIYAEIVSGCDRHYKGQKIIFPDMHKSYYMCPAGFNNIFPFLNFEVPDCITGKMRCPDWKEDIFYEKK